MTQFDSAGLGGSTKGIRNHQNDIRYSGGVVFRFSASRACSPLAVKAKIGSTADVAF
jgi:hypothetical protein